jgi:hypothetical protein
MKTISSNNCIYVSKYWHIYIYIYMIYLTAVGLTPGGSGTVHIYTQTVHRIQRRNIHNNKELNIHNNQKINQFGKFGPCPVFDELYPGICLTTEEKARKNLSQSSITYITNRHKVQHTNNEQYKTQKKNSNAKYYNVTEQYRTQNYTTEKKVHIR